jgi:hypothetical protein
MKQRTHITVFLLKEPLSGYGVFAQQFIMKGGFNKKVRDGMKSSQKLMKPLARMEKEF